jgi:hypothetical protein
MNKRKNRSLDTIADDIHKLARSNIFDIGAYLLEARELCEHGNWLDWLFTEFEYAVSTAERYMNAARLSAKFPTVRNLKLAANTVYALTDECEEGDLPAVIDELAKHATEKQLKYKEAERVILISIGRHRYGDHPDATLMRLAEIADYNQTLWFPQAVESLLKQQPATDEMADSIVDEIRQAYLDAEQAKYEAEWEVEHRAREQEQDEAEAILDGPPPVLPPSITPPDEPQKLGNETTWEGTGQFIGAVGELLDLSTKPATRFAGVFSPDDLNKVADFLRAVAAADKAKTEAA